METSEEEIQELIQMVLANLENPKKAKKEKAIDEKAIKLEKEKLEKLEQKKSEFEFSEKQILAETDKVKSNSLRWIQQRGYCIGEKINLPLKTKKGFKDFEGYFLVKDDVKSIGIFTQDNTRISMKWGGKPILNRIKSDYK
jgi:hypothetical protein